MAFRNKRLSNSGLSAYELAELGVEKKSDQTQEFMAIKLETTKALEASKKKAGDMSKIPNHMSFAGEAKNDYHDYLFKFVMIGKSNSGQLSLLERLVKDDTKENSLLEENGKLWGGEFYTLNIDDKRVKLQIFDRAMQKKRIIPQFIEGRMVYLCCTI